MKYITYTLLFICFLMASCSKWLDVKPEDRTTEDQLLSTPQGFADVANGFYIRNGSNELYGRNLTMTTMDILAQLYLVSSQNKEYAIANFNYADGNARDFISNTWGALYTQIANVNKFIQSLDQYGNRISETLKGRYLGEAYGLRAFYYLDLVRMFTPKYTSPDSVNKVIPYYDKITPDIRSYTATNDIMQQILNDLKTAEELLLKNDAAVSQSRVSAETTGPDNSRTKRNYFMNYYAVRALKARAYLWMGKTADALEEAKFLISVQPKFRWILPADLSTPSTCNKIFSTELIFAVENPILNDVFNAKFSPTLFDADILAPNISGTFINNTVFEGSPLDYRSQYSWKVAGRPFPTFFKYQDLPSSGLAANRTVPLIRMGEMYLIAAECEPDLPSAIGYLNELKGHRNTNPLSPSSTTAQLTQAILKEYRKEFYGEGQLFFFYKRTGATSIIAAKNNGSMAINAANYTFPVPFSETDPR
ncbi:RagB/SusD family nutrient uptake outer membrane protein [Pseudoflavitalea sp. G-6-1-2]|uniref:RagB/SusD family nutrient uptake outer membrane protein n=1 Tax=Pseudoflavitalea sp. G-6-1-2 TaxID=2728841 RepID=UPI00146F1584|nr:RagB/SusD family nutrient uptake outer membrane protein [Pseudoflavitalea sp. G-6-1-2]NML23028.1 RagB/SusD family nutrient uptake outer membrane protein [Pseudoflavitalea sp. G-6-1-2]